jgi:hypothetical protein
MGLTVTEQIESRYQRQLSIDAARANHAGKSLDEFRAERMRQIKRWADRCRSLMEVAGVDEPAAVLPELIQEVVEETIKHARLTAQVVVRAELERLLRKAISS